MEEMCKKYGDKKGKEVFYASINEKKKGSEKWHEPEKEDKRPAGNGRKTHYNQS
jgi:hypothetical protein